MSSVTTPRDRRAAYSSSPKSSPTGPTTRVSARNEDASEKCTAEPPSRRSRLPDSVSTASKAMQPTTVSDMRRERVVGEPSRQPPSPDRFGMAASLLGRNDDLRRARPLRAHHAGPERRGVPVAESDPGTGDPAPARGARRDRAGPDRPGQDGRLRAAVARVRGSVRPGGAVPGPDADA